MVLLTRGSDGHRLATRDTVVVVAGDLVFLPNYTRRDEARVELRLDLVENHAENTDSKGKIKIRFPSSHPYLFQCSHDPKIERACPGKGRMR